MFGAEIYGKCWKAETTYTPLVPNLACVLDFWTSCIFCTNLVAFFNKLLSLPTAAVLI